MILNTNFFSQRFSPAFQSYVFALFAAGIIATVTALPQMLLQYELGGSYRGIIATGTDAEEYYLVRVREAYDGHASVSSPDLFEYKEKSSPQGALSENIIAGISKIFSISVPQAIVYGKFIFPFFFSLVLYGFIYFLTRNKPLALTVPFFVILGSNFIFHPKDIFFLLTLQWNKLGSFLEYLRPINPQMSSLLFFLWLWTFMVWMRKGNIWIFFLSSALLGSLFYAYLYSWTLAYAIVAMFFIFSFKKDAAILGIRKKKLIALVFLSFVFSIPYWMNFFELRQDVLYSVLQRRYGFFQSHEALWSNFLFFDLALLFFLYRKKEKDMNYYLFLSVILSLWALINQQVTTGLRFYPGHWHWYSTAPFTIILVLLAFFKTFQTKERFMKWIAAVFILAAFTNGAVRQTNAYRDIRESSMKSQRQREVFDWLNKNTQKDDVVLADKSLNVNLGIYTHNNNYLTRWGHFYLIPHERLEDSFLAQAFLNQADEKNIEKFIHSDNRYLYEIVYGRHRLRSGECTNECVHPREVEEWRIKYLSWKDAVDFEKFLKKYRMNYALEDTQEYPEWNLGRFSFLKFITEINGVKIFQVL